MSDNHRPDGYHSELKIDPQYDTHSRKCSCTGCTTNAILRRRAKDAAMTKPDAELTLKSWEAVYTQGPGGPDCTCAPDHAPRKQRALCPVCDRPDYDKFNNRNEEKATPQPIALNGPFIPIEMHLYNLILEVHEAYGKVYENNGAAVDAEWAEGIHKLQDVMLNRAMQRMYPNLFNK